MQNVNDHDISDATSARLLRVIAIALAACIAVVGGVGIGRWVTGSSQPEPLGPVDIGFFQDMIDHHLQAIHIAEAYLAQNSDNPAAPYAREVPMFQGFEIERMDRWLTKADQRRGAADRVAMSWMNMGSSVAEMPGMQTPERIGELSAATGAEADRLFFEIMSAHHLGGVHMAEYAAKHADSGETRQFAETMAYNQRLEIVEYELAVRRLGL